MNNSEDLERMRRFGAYEEQERIVKLLEDFANRLDTMRPESYKRVADKMDLRIRTVRYLVNLIKGEQELKGEPE